MESDARIEISLQPQEIVSQSINRPCMIRDVAINNSPCGAGELVADGDKHAIHTSEAAFDICIDKVATFDSQIQDFRDNIL